MINVFIPHRWMYKGDYENIVKLLDRTKFKVRDYSVPKSDPFENIDHRYSVDPQIKRQIDYASVVICSNRPANNNGMAIKEISYAISVKKPVVAIRMTDNSSDILVNIFYVDVIALAVKLDSPGPVFYRQERLGKNGKPFQLVKFRSMRTDAEKAGAQWAKEHDPRVTRMGHIMRACRLDELPQFWGVVKGDLSLVGPRPERAVFYDAFEKYIPGFKQRLMVTPGITGLAQVNGGYDLKPAEKIQYDVEYIKHQSFGMDMAILMKTVMTVLLGTKGGADNESKSEFFLVYAGLQLVAVRTGRSF